jgi:ribosomal protein L22
MTPDETPETEPEKPRRRRRKAAASEDAPASEAPRSSGPEAESESEATRGASSADASPEAEASADVVEETPEDVEAEEAAADVMLEADAEAEDDDEAAAEAEEAPPAAPAPSRRRRGQRGERRDVVVRAQAKYVRSSARKARLVCDHIRGKSVDEARAILAHTSRAVARDWSKLLESAVANAENNHELVGEDLYVMAVHADEGPTIRRFRPRAMGRATRIRKRTSHLTILLTPKD